MTTLYNINGCLTDCTLELELIENSPVEQSFTLDVTVKLLGNMSIIVQKTINVNIVMSSCINNGIYLALDAPTNPQFNQYTSSNPLVLNSMNESNFLTWNNINELVATNYGSDDCGEINIAWYQSFGTEDNFKIELLDDSVFTFD